MQKSSTRWWDLPSALLLFFIILIAASRLQTTEWTDGLNRVRSMALLGSMVGLALGQSKFQRRGVIFLSIGYFLVLWIWQLLGMIGFGKEIPYFGDRLMILFGRLWLGFSEFGAGRPVKDSLFFVMIFCIPYWIAALFSGYQLTRHANALAAVLPGGILMFVIHFNHYTRHDYSWLFGFYLFTALLLLGRQKFVQDKIQWRERHIQVAAESGTDLSNTVMISAAILILIAWTSPSPLTFNTQVKAAWQTLSDKIFPQNDRVDNIFAAAKKENQPVSEVYRNEMALGTQAEQSENIALLVYAPSTTNTLPRLYWRGILYDRYENGRWSTGGLQNLKFKPQNGDFNISDFENRSSLEFTFNVYLKDQTLLYSAAQPLSVSHAANVRYKNIPVTRNRQDNTEDPAALMDVISLQANPPLQAGDSYHAKSLIANPAISELRAAGTNYPLWVQGRYLQLPEDFPARIRSLAAEVTSAYDTPYDRTAAITDYLRRNIQYSPEISFPDPALDPLEYFLFDLKKGFCNYSASAEVLMLRSVGIPARLAVGFAQGEANSQNTFYTVRERDTHAWPEVYFPRYGWVEFEPTGNQSALIRPEKPAGLPAVVPTPAGTETVTPTPEPSQPASDPAQPLFTSAQIILVAIAAGGSLLFVTAFLLKRHFAPNQQTAILLKNALERNGWESPPWLERWVQWTLLTPIEKSFQRINTSLIRLGNPQPVHATPAERAAILMELLPSAAPDIEILLREHQSGLFSPRAGDAALAGRAARTILYQTFSVQIKSSLFGIQLKK